jgi:tRNA 2-selenouridine synthase
VTDRSPLPGRDRADVRQLAQFDQAIDVRTPAEFAEDHVPGAINLPVLSNEERAQVGTIYKQVSPFHAKKLGAALVARNIARHLETELADRPRTWRPLVYCWRGGKRSGALTHVLREIGWDARQLEGGYKSYRRAVVADLETLPARLRFRVVCGLTGSGKSRLLGILAGEGGEVLDLEQLAAHRGSVLGNLPDAAQPSQKLFESRLWDALRRLDPARPVYVESESKRIGQLHVPQALIDRMWSSECVQVVVDRGVRVELLKEEYEHFLRDPDALGRQLDCLVQLHGRETIERWKQLAQAGHWDALVDELLVRHYDPAYTRSIVSHYPALPRARQLEIASSAPASYAAAARTLLADEREPALAE